MVKIVSLSDEAYGKLSMIKRNMSFSNVILNLIEKRNKRNLRDFAGILSEKEGKNLNQFVKDNRKKQKMREVKF